MTPWCLQFNLKIWSIYEISHTLIFFLFIFTIHYHHFCNLFFLLVFLILLQFFPFHFLLLFHHITHPFYHFTIPATHTVALVSRNTSLNGYFFHTHQEIYVPLGCILSCDSLPGIPLESRADYSPPTFSSSFLILPIPSSLCIYLVALVNRASSFTFMYIQYNTLTLTAGKNFRRVSWTEP